jgi:ABC-type multidrug transport system, ATPase component
VGSLPVSPTPDQSEREAAVRVQRLTKRYGDVLANDDLSFSVHTGEVFGYLGPNGAGKTTTIRTLLGLVKPTAGTAFLLGHDVRDRRALVEAKRRVGYLPDDPGFDGSVTGRTILDLHASVKGDERSQELLELFDPPVDRAVRTYSSGNVRKLGLVTAFMHDPDLVILDEPTGGLDPLMKQRFAAFVRDEQRRGVTVLFSSHVLGEVRRLCDRVAIVRDGRLVTVDPVETLLQRSGKAVRVVSADPLPRSLFDLAGVHDLHTPGDDESVTECAFTFTGDVNALLDRLSGHDLVDVSIEEAPLEDVFMRFYGASDA